MEAPAAPRHARPLKALTQGIVEFYKSCSVDYAYSTSTNPKRSLTWPCEGVHNGGLDNAEHNYICRVGDEIQNEEEQKTYEILESLGQGSFGQVLKCQVGAKCVALKISKNRPAYFNQGCVEANILKQLNQSFDRDDTQHIVRMLDCFVFRKHLCIAFELLDMNLLEFLKWNAYKGVSIPTIQSITRELSEALQCLAGASLIHCDLKPENVMVCSLSPMRIKLIDFGSACTESCLLHSYIQSRFYRSPEVIVGLPYSNAIDLWSLGCISAELLLGLPLFPGQCEYDQLRCIVKVLGLPPKEMLQMGSKSKRYFRRPGDVSEPEAETPEPWRLKTGEEYERDSNKKAVRSKRGWSFRSVEEIVPNVTAQRDSFQDFLRSLLQLEPARRLTAAQALRHPFILEAGDFNPPARAISPTSDRRGKALPSSTTGTPASSPNCSSTSAVSHMRTQLPSPWHLPSPASDLLASDSNFSGGSRTSRPSDSDSSREGRRSRFWQQSDVREALGLGDGRDVLFFKAKGRKQRRKQGA